ncbi:MULTISPECIES: MFS transporter [Haloarcula]|uniref:MFS transporter n=1 Tax=Haloarcula TaxID=2237 RepID=UPI0023E8BBA2|nr:MFS transporter [Halomicroarcula sp. SHR3]
MADTTGNGFLIVLLPAYLAAGSFSLHYTLGPITLAESALIGFGLGIYSLVSAGLQRYTGRLSDAVVRRRLFVLAGLSIVGIGSFCYPFVDRYPAVVAVRAMQGFGAALALPASMAIVSEVSETGDRGENMGLFNSVRLTGYVIGPSAGGLLLANGPYWLTIGGEAKQISGFTAAFFAAGMLAATGILLVALVVPETVGGKRDSDSDSLGSLTGKKQFLHPVIALGIASFFIAITPDLIVALQPAINERLGQSEAMFGLEYSALILALTLLMMPFGRASDKFGRRPLLLLGTMLLVPAILVQAVITSPVMMIGARLFQGVAIAMGFSPALAFVGDLAESGNSGHSLAIVTTAYGFGRALGPILGGFFGGFGYKWPFIAGGLLTTMSLVIIATQVRKPEWAASDENRLQSDTDVMT